MPEAPLSPGRQFRPVSFFASAAAAERLSRLPSVWHAPRASSSKPLPKASRAPTPEDDLMPESPAQVTPYQVLGVAPTVDHDELRRAYRRKLR